MDLQGRVDCSRLFARHRETVPSVLECVDCLVTKANKNTVFDADDA